MSNPAGASDFVTMRRKLLYWTAGFAALLGALWFLAFESGTGDGGRTRTDDRAPSGTSARDPGTAPGSVTEATPSAAPPIPGSPFREVPEPAPTPWPVPGARSAPPQDRTAAEAMVFEGRVVVADASGKELRSCTGRFRLASERPEGVDRTLEVSAGAFRTTLPPLESFQVYEAVFDGEAADVEGDVFTPTPGRPLVLRFRQRSAISLRVLGEDTRADLRNVSVVRPEEPWRGLDPHPGTSGTTVIRGEDSPLRLPAPQESYTGIQKAWIGAEGYAWAPFSWSSTAGGEFQVILPRGGGLEVSLGGPPPPEAAVLRIRSAEGGRPDAEVALPRSGPLRIDGLRPGRYDAAVEVGAWFDVWRRLGNAACEVRAGAVSRVTVLLDSALDLPVPVRAAGILVLPPEWGLKEVSLSFRPDASIKALAQGWASAEVSTEDPAPGTTDTFPWSVASLLPGRWSIVVDPSGYRTWLEIPKEGTDSLRITVPPPAEVRGQVIDARTGLPVRADRVTWMAELELSNGGSLDHVAPDAEGRFVIRAPLGWIEVNCHPEGYTWSQETIEVRPGVNTCELRVTRASGICVRLRDGDDVLPWEDWQIELKNDRTGDGPNSWATSGTRHTITGIDPGPCTLTLPEIPGFRPVAPLQVEVRDGEITEVVIPLERVK